MTNDDVDGADSGDSECSSFEMLLPDFSSLAIGETLSKEEPIYSKVQKSRVDQNQVIERFVTKCYSIYASNQIFNYPVKLKI